MEKDILDRSFARFGYAGLDKCTSLVVIGWLEEFFSLNVVVTESPERGLALENVIPWVSVKLGRTVKVARERLLSCKSWRISSFAPYSIVIKRKERFIFTRFIKRTIQREA